MRLTMGMTVAEIAEMLRRADADELSAIERALAADQRKGVRKALDSARKRVDAEQAERTRIDTLYAFEESLVADRENPVIVGLDEVGRGSVAGPLAVAAVVLPRSSRIAGLNDSKQIKPDQRAEIAAVIEDCALAWHVEYVEASVIDERGMSAALRLAFSGALEHVRQQGSNPCAVLVDGNPLHIDENEINVVKGDGKCATIAAASIVAKVHRDEVMCQLASSYPEYQFDVNKGYASPQHIEAIKQYGLCPLHRASFCKSFLQETLF